MPPPRTVRARLVVTTACLAAALVVLAGCGSAVTFGGDPAQPAPNTDIQLVNGTAQTNGTAGDGGTSATAGPGPAAPARWVQLSSKQSALGTIVTDVTGRTLYRFDKDKAQPPTTNCSGTCAGTWPPVTIEGGGKVFLDGADGQAVGSLKRPDGSTQVTIGGWPVYRFSGDQKAGDTNGQGVSDTWFAVTPTGAKASSSSSSSSGRTPTQGGSATAGDDSASSKGGAALGTTKGPGGTVVTDGKGRTVYVNTKDSRSPSRSHCTSSGACAGFDAVRSQPGGRVDIPGVQDSAVGSIRSSGGAEQMTLNGYPLYTSTDDQRRGDVTADGRDGQWYALGLDSDK